MANGLNEDLNIGWGLVIVIILTIIFFVSLCIANILQNFILPLIIFALDVIVFFIFFLWPLEIIGEIFPVYLFFVVL
jgi:hypothetical protein